MLGHDPAHPAEPEDVDPGREEPALRGSRTGMCRPLRITRRTDRSVRPGDFFSERVAVLGARIRPGWFAQTQSGPDLHDRTLVEVLGRGDRDREGRERGAALSALRRYELQHHADQSFGSLSGGRRARFQIPLLALQGSTLLLLDEPTDNLDLHSAEALEIPLERFEGTVLAVTHDRWFARAFDRYVVLENDGRVRETSEPYWGG